MEDLSRRLETLTQLSITAIAQVIDVVLVAYVVYRALKLVRGTRAWRILGGIIIFVIALFLSDFFQLHTLHWILDKATVLAPVALVILLLPELRQTLEGFAKLGLWPERLILGEEKTTAANTVEEIIAAVIEMGNSHVGAIIIIERNIRLDDIIATGVLIQARASATLIKSIFYYGNPLHDGAVVIRGDQILAAACRLPLSESFQLDPNTHMRHRAGLGITEQTDAIAIIVSEERGTISVALENRIQRIPSAPELREFLNQEIRGITTDKPPRKRRKLKNLIRS